MSGLGWIAVAIAGFVGAWMVFDGVRALTAGDYVTPRTGPYAGQLGPWASLVRRAGVEPRSVGMKTAFVLLGLAWLAAAAGYAGGVAWADRALVILSILSLWYLPIGTALAILELILLLVIRIRGG